VGTFINPYTLYHQSQHWWRHGAADSLTNEDNAGAVSGNIVENIDQGHDGPRYPIVGKADAAAHSIHFRDVRGGLEVLTAMMFSGTTIVLNDDLFEDAVVVAMSGTFHRVGFRWLGAPGSGAGRWEAIDHSSGIWAAFSDGVR
jgi:hypothetical protein